MWTSLQFRLCILSFWPLAEKNNFVFCGRQSNNCKRLIRNLFVCRSSTQSVLWPRPSTTVSSPGSFSVSTRLWPPRLPRLSSSVYSTSPGSRSSTWVDRSHWPWWRNAHWTWCSIYVVLLSALINIGNAISPFICRFLRNVLKTSFHFAFASFQMSLSCGARCSISRLLLINIIYE